ncbi:hypothetical protein FI667_g13292, partial [Globisporangium splendens]
MAQRVWFLLVDASGNALSSASSVRLASDDVVDDFRDAVKGKYADSHLVGIAPSDLVIYVNRAAFDEKQQPLTPGAAIRTCDSSESDTLVVEVPKRQFVEPELLELQHDLLHHVLLDALSSTSAQSNKFKTELCATYNCGLPNEMVRCMLLDTALSSAVVIASHLFRRSNEFLSMKLMGIPDIDDVRNGLLLFKPLELASDHFQISFIYDKSSDEFRLEVFDRSLRQQRLFVKLDENQRDILLQGQTLPKK